MNPLLHLCKKDFAFTKYWLYATWAVLILCSVFPWIFMGKVDSDFFLIFEFLAPRVMVFLAASRVIHCDPFVDPKGFIRTRPVSRLFLLQSKFLFIFGTLLLPAVALEILKAALFGFDLSIFDYLILTLEKGILFSLIVALAVAYSVISSKFAIMLLWLFLPLVLIFYFLFFINSMFPDAISSQDLAEDENLRASFGLFIKTFLTSAMILTALVWVARRNKLLTASCFLVSGMMLFFSSKYWKWNFIDQLSHRERIDLSSKNPSLFWQEPPSIGLSNVWSSNGPPQQVSAKSRIEGLDEGWFGKFVSHQAEAVFKNGEKWMSIGDRNSHLNSGFATAILPQLGVEVSDGHPMKTRKEFHTFALFEYEKKRLRELKNRKAKISGIGLIQIYRPQVLCELPVVIGASAVHGRSRYRLKNIDVRDGVRDREIFYEIEIRSLSLASRGDGLDISKERECLFVSSDKQHFATDDLHSIYGSSVADTWRTLKGSLKLTSSSANAPKISIEDFLKNARIYIIGKEYGGTIKLPYEIQEIELK